MELVLAKPVEAAKPAEASVWEKVTPAVLEALRVEKPAVAEAWIAPVAEAAAAVVAAAVPGTRPTAAVAEAASVMVWKMTCGMVRTVEMTVVVEVLGMTEPEDGPLVSVQGTVRVVRTLTVVTGMLDVAAAEVAEAGLTAVTVEAAVTMAGLLLICAAQIPWK